MTRVEGPVEAARALADDLLRPGAERVDATHWVAVNRLEGDFPGGVAELRYRFTLADDLVTELVIAP